MKRYLNLNDRAFNAIKNKTKRIEIRANTGNTDCSQFEIGDIIIFANSNNETINCKITEINKYGSIQELLMIEGTRYTLSSTNDYDDSNKFLEAGGVSSAILTKNGNIYTGVCIDTSCSLGMCAERNAISTMITNGETEILKVVCIGSEGDFMMPCGACMEYMMQLSDNSENIEILKKLETKEFVKLKELIPTWWGKER